MASRAWWFIIAATMPCLCAAVVGTAHNASAREERQHSDPNTKFSLCMKNNEGGERFGVNVRMECARYYSKSLSADDVFGEVFPACAENSPNFMFVSAVLSNRGNNIITALKINLQNSGNQDILNPSLMDVWIEPNTSYTAIILLPAAMNCNIVQAAGKLEWNIDLVRGITVNTPSPNPLP